MKNNRKCDNHSRFKAYRNLQKYKCSFVVGNVSIRLDEGEAWAQIQANGGNGILNAGAETGTLFDYVKLAFHNIKRLNDMYKTIKIDKFVMEHESSSATNSKYLRYFIIFNF